MRGCSRSPAAATTPSFLRPAVDVQEKRATEHERELASHTKISPVAELAAREESDFPGNLKYLSRASATRRHRNEPSVPRAAPQAQRRPGKQRPRPQCPAPPASAQALRQRYKARAPERRFSRTRRQQCLPRARRSEHRPPSGAAHASTAAARERPRQSQEQQQLLQLSSARGGRGGRPRQTRPLRPRLLARVRPGRPRLPSGSREARRAAAEGSETRASRASSHRSRCVAAMGLGRGGAEREMRDGSTAGCWPAPQYARTTHPSRSLKCSCVASTSLPAK